MKKGNPFIWSILILMIVCLVSCDKEESTTLTRAQKKLADSIYSKQITIVRKQLDSLCAVNKNDYFRYYVDSLKEDYINSIGEIEEYLKSGE